MSAGLPGFHELGGEFGLQATLRKSDILYVGFDDISKVRTRRRVRDGWGYLPARKNGWAYLGVQTFAENWYRDAALIARLEHLRDEGFFREYGRVIFSGASMGAFAACAFAPLAPGCTIIAYSPQSTLHPDITAWDDRYPQGTIQDWTLPYSDAAIGVAAAGRAWAIYDRGYDKDRMHADRMAGEHIIHLPARYSNHFAMGMINNAGILSQVTAGCADLTMTPAKFAQLYRQARANRAFLERLARKVADRPSGFPKQQLHRVLVHRGRPWIAGLVAKSLA